MKRVMGYKLKEDHVRIRTTFGGSWIWELVTGEGHIVCVSQPFSDRDECEDSAKKHGLPVTGGRKTIKGRAGPRRPPGSRVFCNGRGLWIWEHVSEDGRVEASSSARFLTREECERDLAERNPMANGGVSLSKPPSSLRPLNARSDRSASARRTQGGVKVYKDSSELWHWEWRDRDGARLAQSSVAFLTQEECARDAELRCEVKLVVVEQAEHQRAMP